MNHWLIWYHLIESSKDLQMLGTIKAKAQEHCHFFSYMGCQGSIMAPPQRAGFDEATQSSCKSQGQLMCQEKEGGNRVCWQTYSCYLKWSALSLQITGTKLQKEYVKKKNTLLYREGTMTYLSNRHQMLKSVKEFFSTCVLNRTHK